MCSFSLNAQQTVGVFNNQNGTQDGYTLFSPNTSTYLIDNCGRMIKEWESEHQVSVSVYLQENGDLLRSSRVSGGSFSGGGAAGRIERFNWDGDLEWTYEYANAEYQAHHDFEPLPNGNILLIAWERRSALEHEDAGGITPVEIWSEKVVELKPLGKNNAQVVWEWYIWDRAIQAENPDLPNYGLLEDHPERLDINFGKSFPDWIHFNAIDYNVQRDEILLSSRNTNEIYIIDHSTTTEEAAGRVGGNKGKGGDFLFRWGNPRNHGVDTNQQLFGQHDAQWIPEGYPDAGEITIFNNNNPSELGLYSSVIQINPYENGNYTVNSEKAFLPETVNWSYTSIFQPNFHEPKQCGAMRLANGNTLITNSRKGVLFEVDQDGVEQWRYHNPVALSGPVVQGATFNNSSIFRAVKYAASYVAFDNKDMTPGLPIELMPANDFCTNTATTEQSKEAAINLLNQSTEDVLTFNVQNTSEWTIQIFDITGKLVKQSNISQYQSIINTATLLSGNYFVKAIDVSSQEYQAFKFVKK